METIEININRESVYEEVAKATDYTGSKLMDKDSGARERILAADEDLASLGRFWDESVIAVNDRLKSMLISYTNTEEAYLATLEVSKSFDKGLRESVETSLKSCFIANIIGLWFKFANKEEAGEYFATSGEMVQNAERLLYSRRRPSAPR